MMKFNLGDILQLRFDSFSGTHNRLAYARNCYAERMQSQAKQVRALPRDKVNLGTAVEQHASWLIMSIAIENVDDCRG